MSFAVLVRDVLSQELDIANLDEHEELVEEISALVQSTLLDTLKDTTVRRETYEHTIEDVAEVDMMQVHTVLDALIKVVSEEVPADA